MSDQNNLIQILFEEFTSNGSYFSSPDSDFYNVLSRESPAALARGVCQFKQAFGDFGESNQEIFKRLLDFP